MSNEVYDALKAVAQVWLPAIATLWVAISSIWGLPLANEIEQTITAIVVFMDAVLGIALAKASADYNKKGAK